jgi:hypothetical protein
MAKFKIKKKDVKGIVSAILVVAVVVGAIAGISSLFNRELKEIHPAFSVGGLTESGKFVEQDNTIYTKELFECKDLSIEVDFESNIFYKIFFYSDSGDFISATENMTENFVDSIPDGAVYARVLISPDWESLKVEKDDRVIRWFEIFKYSNQITIRVAAESKKTDEDTVLTEDDITDLGGTTWVFNSFKCSPKYSTFALENGKSLATVCVYFSSSDKYSSFEITEILLGYGYDSEEEANKVLVLKDSSETVLNVGDTITFVSSSISTDPDLINFMRENAVLINN